MPLNPYIEVVVAAVIWGSAGVFVKYLNLPAPTLTFFRLAVPAIILWAFFVYQKKPLFKGDNRLILFGSLLNVAKTFFYFLGFTLTSVGNAIIVYFIWPVFTALLGAAVLKEKISKINMLLFALAFAGIVLIFLNKKFSFFDHDFIGMAAMMVSALATAVFMVLFKKVTVKYSKYEMIFYQNIVGAFIFLPFLFMGLPLSNLSQLAVVITYSILIGVVGFVFYFSALSKIKVSTASFLSYFEPISAVLFGVFLLGETISWNMVAGGFLIIASAMMLEKN
ncbi:MAG: DMT family transporter [Candidatus Paceibacterota bacterium]